MLIFTQGDDNIVLNMTATDGGGNPVDLTSAVFQTQFKGSQGLVTIDNSAHTADPNQTANKGKYTITLTAAQTGDCQRGDVKDMVTKIVQSGVTIYYHGKGLVQVLPKAPLA